MKSEFLLSLSLGLGVVSAVAATEPVTNSFNVRFESAAVADSVIAATGDVVFKRIIPVSGKPELERRHKEAGLDLLYTVELKDERQVAAQVERFRGIKGIKSAEPTRFVKMSETLDMMVLDELSEEAPVAKVSQGRAATEGVFPNDPLYSRQWHYANPDYVNINLEKAWEIEKGDPKVIVAVMDCWIDHSHPDLAGNMWTNEAELNGLPGVDDDGNGYVDDIYGYNWSTPGNDTGGEHGTHIAGTIAAVNNNGIGGCGIAGGDGVSPGVRIMSLGINPAGQSSGFVEDWKIAQAFVYAADNGAVISSNSWGGALYVGHVMTSGMNYFIDYAGMYEGSPMKGGLIMIAAGNSNYDKLNSPSNDPDLKRESVIIVGSVDHHGVKSNFSNYGFWVDIMAPGGGDMVKNIYSTYPGGGYRYMSGTSMACPHVTGIAALVVSHFGDGSLTPVMVKKMILDSAQDVYQYNGGYPYSDVLGKGIADAYGALLSDPAAAPGNAVDFSVTKDMRGNVTISMTIPSDGNGQAVANARIYREGFKIPMLSLPTGGFKPGIRHDFYFAQGRINADGPIAVQTVDRWGNESEISGWNDVTLLTDELVVQNPYGTDEFQVFLPSTIAHELLHPDLELSFPLIYEPTSESKSEVSLTDPNGIATAEIQIGMRETDLCITIIPRAETPKGRFPLTVTVKTQAPDAEKTFTIYYVVSDGYADHEGPLLRPGVNTKIYVDKMEGHLDIDTSDFFYCPYSTDVILEDKEWEDSYIHTFKARIENQILSIDYAFDENELGYGEESDALQFDLHPVNEYRAMSDISFMLIPPIYSGIGQVEATTTMAAPKGIYNLLGVKLDTTCDKLAPGIYIIDGKKTLIR